MTLFPMTSPAKAMFIPIVRPGGIGSSNLHWFNTSPKLHPRKAAGMIFYRVCVADSLRFLMLDLSLLEDEPIAYLVCLGELDSGLSMKMAGNDLCFENGERGRGQTLRLQEFCQRATGEGVYYADGEPHVVRWAKAQSEDGLLSARGTHTTQCLSRGRTATQRSSLQL